VTRAACVLNTRPREQAAELSALLRAAGFEPVEAPAIEIQPAWEPAELQRVSADLRGGLYAWLVLQSANAAASLPLEHVNVLCGEATARALGAPVAQTLARFSATAAVEALRPLLRPADCVLVPRAADGREELIDGLAELDVRVDAPIAYRTVAASASQLAALRDAPVDGVTFCSPSAVRALLAALGGDWVAARRVVCLGETTAATARESRLRVDATAAETSMHSLVQAVASVLGVTA